ncbi:MAG: ABC transporter substrate-binding protein [Spirochaetales bacterium]|nr:ABC transporter substrate-binding protein [Spirochaetales bacterium]
MPLAKVAVSAAVDETKKKDVLKRLSLSIAEKIGKPEKYVQTIFEANVPMTFAGTFEPAASLEIKSIGGLSPSVCKGLSEACCGLLQKELGIPEERIYIVFSDIEASSWGWNGTTFG